MSNYCNLHCHTSYSLLDGFGIPEKMVERAAALGQVAIGVTEHGNMSSVLAVNKACRKYGVKHIVGSELYISPWGRTVDWRRDDKKRAGTAFHLTCLAFSQTGYQNLLKLTELSNKMGFFYVPRIDYDMLERYNEGLIVTSGCMAGAIPRALNPETGVKASDYREVNDILGFMLDVFGPDRYYLELQDHDIPELREINIELFRVNKHYGFEYLATNDSHYATADDAEGQADALCVSSKCSRLNPSEFVQGYIDHPDYFLTTYQQMTDKDYGFDVPESAFTNTVKVAEMVEDIKIGYEPEVKQYRFPVMPEYEHDYDGELEKIAGKGFSKIYAKQDWESWEEFGVTEETFLEAGERLAYELTIIKYLGFASYFLCVYDIKQFCDEKGIPMTVRGSAGGSIVLYCLGITDFCPLEYNLIFERFLNPDRVSAPDADLDIDPGRRAEVIRYIEGKYGADKVAQVVTFSYIKGRGAIRDAARLNEAPFYVGDEMVSRMSENPKVTVAGTNEEGSEYYVDNFATSPLEEQIFETAVRLEGQIRSFGIHAGAVLLSDRPLVKDYPLMRPKSTSKSVTSMLVAIDYESAEEVGGIKLDILGVEALGILYETMKLVNERHGESYTFDTVPTDDPVSFDLINSGNLAEIFQLSGYTARIVTAQIKPQTVEDVMAINALARPGPLQYAHIYADRMHGVAEIEYKHPNMALILADTQGIMIYQEQVMRVSQLFAGFTGGEADILRKAVSKKKGFSKIRENFITGCRDNGYSEDLAEELWDDILHFAGYGFNASHACAYSRLAVKMAYLKGKYPLEFYSAAMTGRGKNEGKLDELLKEMVKADIKLLPPRLGRSAPVMFAIDDEAKGIRYPYGSVKNVGKAGIHLSRIDIESIDDVTKNELGLFKKAGKRAMEALAMVGTFDHLFLTRNSAIMAVEYLSKGFIPMYQTSFTLEEDRYTTSEFYVFERELTGLYLTGHPLDKYDLSDQVPFAEQQIYEMLSGDNGLFIGVVSGIRTHRDKGGNLMAFVEIEDMDYDTMSVVIFASLYKHVHDRIERGAVIKVLGEINARYGRTDEEEAKLKKYGRVSILAQQILGS